MHFARVMPACSWFSLVLCTLGACTSLPDVEPPGQETVAAVLLSGAHGALSPQQSQTILGQLRKRSGNTSVLEHHLAREEAIVGSPLTTGNSVKLLQDGPATYRAMFDAIAAAKDHINLETYILEDDEVGQRVAQVLIDKQQRGVQVHIIHDSVGSFGTSPAFFKQLRDSGIRVLEFNTVNPLKSGSAWELNQREHRKFLIVDGLTSSLGGSNISSVYSGGSF